MGFDPKAYLASKQKTFDPKAYLASKVQPQQDEDPGLGAQALQWIGEKYQDYVDPYTGAPVRAGIGALQKGENPIPAYKEQFGADARTAPTGQELVRNAGVSDKSLSEALPSLYNETGEGWKLKKGGFLDPTASGSAGFALDIAADPLNVIPVSDLARIGVRASDAVGASKLLKKGVAAGSGLISGVPAEVVERLIERPNQVLGAGKKGKALEIAQRGREELMSRNALEGERIGQAKKEFAQKLGETPVDTSKIIEQNKGFLKEKGPVGGEEGALSTKEAKELSDLSTKRLKMTEVGPELEAKIVNKRPAGSLQRFSDYLDSKIKTFENSRLPGGSDTAYQGQLKQLRGQVKGLLHDLDPNGLKAADKRFHEFAKDIDSLGKLEDPQTMEAFINNFYGANKTQMQGIAGKYIPKTVEDIKDLGANRAFGKAQGPAGSEHGFRNMIGTGLLGAGAYTHNPGLLGAGLLTQPGVQKQIVGRGAQLTQTLRKNPELLDKFINPNVRGLMNQTNRKNK